MKKTLFALIAVLFTQGYAMEYEPQIDNDQVTVSRVKIFPNEEIGLHRDEVPQVVIALQGGTITRIESDGRTVAVEFPTNVPVFRSPDPVGQMHKSVNRTPNPIELMIVQIKNR